MKRRLGEGSRKFHNHGEGPSRGHLRDYEPLCGPFFQALHLGFCNKKYTPTARGFDTFEGRYVAIEKEEKSEYLEEKISKIRSKKMHNESDKQKKKQENIPKMKKINYSSYRKRKESRQQNRVSTRKSRRRRPRGRYSRRFRGRREAQSSASSLGTRPEDMESHSYYQGESRVSELKIRVPQFRH